jgi:hypothetical protein
MTMEKVAKVLKLASAYIRTLEERVAELEGYVDDVSIMGESGYLIEKVAEHTGMEPEDIVHTLKGMDESQRLLFEKISNSELPFSLGASSGEMQGESSAEEDLVEFCTSRF